MRGLTLHQPWATLIARGAKHYETRSWSTRYRGPLAIHAGAGEHPLLPAGAIVAVCHLVDVTPTAELTPHAVELALGDWSPGRYAWRLEHVHEVYPPVACKGRQGLWRVPADIAALLPSNVPAGS